MSPRAAKYSITFHKEENVVRVEYDASVPVGGPDLLADFQLLVGDKNVIPNFTPGQTAYKGNALTELADPKKDVTVGFTLSTNQGWSDADHDKLRGDHKYDDASFSN